MHGTSAYDLEAMFSNSNDPETMDNGEIYKLELDGRIVGKFGKAGKLPKEFGMVNSIDCRSEKGRGTVFTVTLPLCMSEEVADEERVLAAKRGPIAIEDASHRPPELTDRIGGVRAASAKPRRSPARRAPPRACR